MEQNPHKRQLDVIDLVESQNDEDSTSHPPKRAMTDESSTAAPTSTPTERDVVVVSSNLPNPNVDYPHRRVDCGVRPWKEDPLLYCPKCYCVVCDMPATQCTQWLAHCHKIPTLPKMDEEEYLEEVMANYMPPSNMTQDQASSNAWPPISFTHPLTLSPEEVEHRPSSITDTLDQNLRQVLQEFDDLNLQPELPRMESGNAQNPPMISKLRMDGDVGQVRLHDAFFVEGVKIGWPFPTILTPQRQMALHIMRALKHRRHVAFESPTGTGRTTAILCSALAWQRYEAQRQVSSGGVPSEPTILGDIGETVEGKVPTIIYCAPSHSEVNNIVAHLRTTPYRPRVTILGSRDQLCINRTVLDKGVNCSVDCSCLQHIHESERRRNQGDYNDDNNPPINAVDDEESGDTRANNHIEDQQSQKPACRYYQRLSTRRSAEAIQERLLLSSAKINNSGGGAGHLSPGIMDIEDIVEFGKNPGSEEIVELYRGPDESSFGLTVGPRNRGGCQILSMSPNGVAAKDGRLQEADWIVGVNGVSTQTWDMERLKAKMSSIRRGPLVLTVRRQEQTDGAESENYSDHAICPYYISRALMKQAHVIFAPYDYILDPNLRRKMNIDFVGNILVLDEAHDIEDKLCESGSGQFSEVDLCRLVVVLSRLANQRPLGPQADEEELRETRPFWAVAHELLLFLERLILYLREERLRFESGHGLTKIKEQHARFPLPDDHSIELNYHGPSGFGILGQAMGCAPILEKLGLAAARCTTLKESALALQSHLLGIENENERDITADEVAFNDLIGIVDLFHLAATNPEHFYSSTTVSPNGNMDYATDIIPSYSVQQSRRHPRVVPFVSPRTETVPRAPIPPCSHKSCQMPDDNPFTQIRHGGYCNGARPRWEAHLNLRLLSPGLLMDGVLQECRTVILASGSLAPIPSLAAELNLLTPHQKANSGSGQTVNENDNKESTTKRPSPEKGGRLQCTPPPLEAGHVVDLKKQLFACAIGKFHDGSSLTVKYSHYSRPGFFPKLGDVIAKVVESIPSGGVLIYFPSHSFLKKCLNCWNPNPNQTIDDTHCTEIWRRLLHSKGHIVVEPTGDEDNCVAACEEYRQQIKDHRQCILLAVFRGKMSEGIPFNDDNARAVLCVGVPYPDSFDRRIKAKVGYNDEQRRIRKNTHLSTGAEWYSQQAYRAIAQALDRCIRHGADYGSLILLDSRHCDDGSSNAGICRAHKNLPKWMRTQVRTLSLYPRQGVGHSPILNGFEGLQKELEVSVTVSRWNASGNWIVNKRNGKCRIP